MPKILPLVGTGVGAGFGGGSRRSAPPCLEVGAPSVIAGGGGTVGIGYQWPIYPLLISASRNPYEIYGTTGGTQTVIAGPGPLDNTTLANAYSAPDIGSAFVDLYARNCYGADYANVGVSVQDAGWATGEPKLLLVYYDVREMETNPASINLANLVLWSEGVTSVVFKDTSDNTTLYSGALTASMVNNTYYTCAKFAESGTRTISVAATNATGTMTLITTLLLQDNLGACP